MDVKNLLGKLHTEEDAPEGSAQPSAPQSSPPKVPAPPVPRPRAPVVEDRSAKIPEQFERVSGGSSMSNTSDDGIILDLGEGISLNIPIQRRMSLTDFIKLAEKVKALEMLSESSDVYKRGPL